MLALLFHPVPLICSSFSLECLSPSSLPDELNLQIPAHLCEAYSLPIRQKIVSLMRPPAPQKQGQLNSCWYLLFFTSKS